MLERSSLRVTFAIMSCCGSHPLQIEFRESAHLTLKANATVVLAVGMLGCFCDDE